MFLMNQIVNMHQPQVTTVNMCIITH